MRKKQEFHKFVCISSSFEATAGRHLWHILFPAWNGMFLNLAPSLDTVPNPAQLKFIGCGRRVEAGERLAPCTAAPMQYALPATARSNLRRLSLTCSLATVLCRIYPQAPRVVNAGLRPLFSMVAAPCRSCASGDRREYLARSTLRNTSEYRSEPTALRHEKHHYAQKPRNGSLRIGMEQAMDHKWHLRKRLGRSRPSCS